MKNNAKLFGIIVLATVMIFAMTACSNDDDTGNKGDDGNGDNNPTPPPPPVSTSYTVTFNVNGGTGTTPTAQTVNAGSSVTLPNKGDLTKSGFTFGGWNTKADGTGTNYSADSSYTPTGDITLYAKWDAIGITYYTVTFNANGGSGTTPAALTTVTDSGIILPSGSDLSMSDNAFGGWNTSPSGTGDNYSAGSSYIFTGDITLYAKWVTIPSGSFTVNFDSNGGSSVDMQITQSGSMADRPVDPTRVGHTFDGWYKENTFTNTWNFTTDTVTANITLYAKWNAVGTTTYTVTFNSNGGTAVSSITNVAHGSIISSPADPTKANNTFGGWFRDPDLINQWNFGANTVTANITLYAKWYSALATEGLLFTLSGNTYSVSKGTATAAEVVIPAFYEGKPVTTIAVNGFSNYANMTGISIPDSVTSIGNYAFNNNVNLKSIAIPNSVTDIGFSMLSGCSSITNVTVPFIGSALNASSGHIGYLFGASSYSGQNAYIPASLKSVIITNIYNVTANTFNGCTGLTSITIPASVTSIGDNAFQGCTGLTGITIPASVTSIGNNAFQGCTGLTGITIPANVTSIGSNAFSSCSALASVTFAEGFSMSIGNWFSNLTNLTSVTIPASVTSIDNQAFSGCSGLTDITIPTSVTSIGSQAFSGCSGLTDITIPTSVTSIGDVIHTSNTTHLIKYYSKYIVLSTIFKQKYVFFVNLVSDPDDVSNLIIVKYIDI